MGVVVDSQEGGEIGGGQGSCSWRFLTRRKKVDSANENNNSESHGQLAKELTVPHLMAIGNSISHFFHFQSCFSSGYVCGSVPFSVPSLFSLLIVKYSVFDFDFVVVVFFYVFNSGYLYPFMYDGINWF